MINSILKFLEVDVCNRIKRTVVTKSNKKLKELKLLSLKKNH